MASGFKNLRRIIFLNMRFLRDHGMDCTLEFIKL